jgi:hypothetical protein
LAFGISAIRHGTGCHRIIKKSSGEGNAGNGEIYYDYFEVVPVYGKISIKTTVYYTDEKKKSEAFKVEQYPYYASLSPEMWHGRGFRVIKRLGAKGAK